MVLELLGSNRSTELQERETCVGGADNLGNAKNKLGGLKQQK